MIYHKMSTIFALLFSWLVLCQYVFTIHSMPTNNIRHNKHNKHTLWKQYTQTHQQLLQQQDLHCCIACQDGILITRLPMHLSPIAEFFLNQQINQTTKNIPDNTNKQSTFQPHQWQITTTKITKPKPLVSPIALNTYAVISGIPSDCQFILRLLREFANKYEQQFQQPITIRQLAEEINQFLYQYHQDDDHRPLLIHIQLFSTIKPSIDSQFQGQICDISWLGSYAFKSFCVNNQLNHDDYESFQPIHKDLTEKMSIFDRLSQQLTQLFTKQLQLSSQGLSSQDMLTQYQQLLTKKQQLLLQSQLIPYASPSSSTYSSSY